MQLIEDSNLVSSVASLTDDEPKPAIDNEQESATNGNQKLVIDHDQTATAVKGQNPSSADESPSVEDDGQDHSKHTAQDGKPLTQADPHAEEPRRGNGLRKRKKGRKRRKYKPDSKPPQQQNPAQTQSSPNPNQSGPQTAT